MNQKNQATSSVYISFSLAAVFFALFLVDVLSVDFIADFFSDFF